MHRRCSWILIDPTIARVFNESLIYLCRTLPPSHTYKPIIDILVLGLIGASRSTWPTLVPQVGVEAEAAVDLEGEGSEVVPQVLTEEVLVTIKEAVRPFRLLFVVWMREWPPSGLPHLMGFIYSYWLGCLIGYGGGYGQQGYGAPQGGGYQGYQQGYGGGGGGVFLSFVNLYLSFVLSTNTVDDVLGYPQGGYQQPNNGYPQGGGY